MKTNTSKMFSLIEVAIAIAILAAGSVAVVALVPVGVKQTQESVSKNYAAIAADGIYSYLSRESKNDWTILDNLPTSRSSEELDNNSNWVKIEGNLYQDPNIPSDKGVFGLQISTNNKADFVAQANIWKSTVSKIILNTGSNSQSQQQQNSTPQVSSYTVTSGGIGMSSTGSQYSFDMTLTNGSTFNRVDMQKNKHNLAYDAPVNFSATKIKMRIKVNDPQTIVADGVSIDLDGRNVTFSAPSSNPMLIDLWNNTGMGKWFIQFAGGSATTITTDDGSDLGLPAGTTTDDPESTNLSPTASVSTGIHIEVSWPIQAPYNERKKLEYYFELFKHSGIKSTP